MHRAFLAQCSAHIKHLFNSSSGVAGGDVKSVWGTHSEHQSFGEGMRKTFTEGDTFELGLEGWLESQQADELKGKTVQVEKTAREKQVGEQAWALGKAGELVGGRGYGGVRWGVAMKEGRMMVQGSGRPGKRVWLCPEGYGEPWKLLLFHLWQDRPHEA